MTLREQAGTARLLCGASRDGSLTSRDGSLSVRDKGPAGCVAAVDAEGYRAAEGTEGQYLTRTGPSRPQSKTLMQHSISADERGLVQACPNCGQRNRAVFEKLGQPFRCSKCKTELHLAGEPFDIESEAVFESLITGASLPVLVDFWAPWCGPCKMVAPEFGKVAASNVGKALIAKINVEQVPNLSARYSINSIPTMAVFKEGREIKRQSGAMPAASIQKFLDSSLL
jgi:thioredoxin 2